MNEFPLNVYMHDVRSFTKTHLRSQHITIILTSAALSRSFLHVYQFNTSAVKVISQKNHERITDVAKLQTIISFSLIIHPLFCKYTSFKKFMLLRKSFFCNFCWMKWVSRT